VRDDAAEITNSPGGYSPGGYAFTAGGTPIFTAGGTPILTAGGTPTRVPVQRGQDYAVGRRQLDASRGGHDRYSLG